MELLTEELIEKCERHPARDQKGNLGDAKVIAKFFSPVGAATWLIVAGDIEKDEQGNINDIEMFGYCYLFDMENAEFGPVYLSELQEVKLPFGLGIERDLYYEDEKITLREACKKEWGRIPEIFQENKDTEQREEKTCIEDDLNIEM